MDAMALLYFVMGFTSAFNARPGLPGSTGEWVQLIVLSVGAGASAVAAYFSKSPAQRSDTKKEDQK